MLTSCNILARPGQKFTLGVKVEPLLPTDPLIYELNIKVKTKKCTTIAETGWGDNWGKEFYFDFVAPSREGIYDLYVEAWVRPKLIRWPEDCLARSHVVLIVEKKPTPPGRGVNPVIAAGVLTGTLISAIALFALKGKRG